MIPTIFSVIGIAIFATALTVRKIRHSVASVRDQTGREWQQLRDLLLSRHLVVTHLVDSLPLNSISKFERTKLADCNEYAESKLRDLSPTDSMSDDYRAVENSQDEFVEHLIFLIDEIQRNPSVAKLKAVEGCLRGLEVCERKIDEAKSTYNTAVIAYHTRLESRRAKCCAILDKKLSFRELNFGWTGSSGSVHQRG